MKQAQEGCIIVNKTIVATHHNKSPGAWRLPPERTQVSIFGPRFAETAGIKTRRRTGSLYWSEVAKNFAS